MMPPIHNAPPITRDLNCFPITDMVSNASTVPPLEPPGPGLITVNLDVQNHVMLFLSTPDLSTLMRTCRHFLDACLLPLCAHSRVILCESDFRRVPSFHRFLRIDAGPSSRAHLIKELWISIKDLDFTVECDPLEMLRASEEWTPAFLDVLRHCHNVRRLRIDRWFLEEVPFPVLVDTIASSLHHLEELTMRTPYAADADILCGLARLPLRRLSFLRHQESDDSPFLTPVSVEGLPRSLTELDIDLCTPINIPFPLVSKLGIRETRVPIDAFVADATTAFPNVTQLILRRHKAGHLCFNAPRIVEQARPLSKVEWQSRYREAWPSLSTIWAEDLCMLHCLGFSKHVSSISISFRRRGEAGYVAPLLADTSPNFLELRVNMDDSFLTLSNDWCLHFGPSVSSVLRLTVLHHTERDHSVKFWNGDLEKVMLDDLCKMLPAFTNLAYLRIRFVPKYTPLDTRSEPLDGQDIRAIGATIRKKYIARFVRANPSLRWIAFEVYDLSLECWEVSKAGEGEAARGGPICTKTSELAGRAVLEREGMNAFRDVMPSLEIVH